MGISWSEPVALQTTHDATGNVFDLFPSHQGSPLHHPVVMDDHDLVKAMVTTGVAFRFSDTSICEHISAWWLGHPSEKYERQLG